MSSNPEFPLNRYCQVALSSPYAWDLYLAANVGTGVKHINVSMVKGLLIPLPPLTDQRRIVERFYQLMLLVEGYGELEDAREALDVGMPVRLLHLDAFVRHYVEVYDKTDDETRSILPLTRIWWPA